ncbi:MAG: hypothetical protein WD595_07065, partial [Waddliaceae bacterium]
MRFIIILLTLTLSLFSQEQLPLEKTNIHEVMQSIFGKHISNKGITKDVIRDSFLRYIERFDPNHTYFLEEEVLPYARLSDEDVLDLMIQYDQEDFSAY